jgi:predicted Zn-ribbon and HTH transcriptional regulator
MILEVDEYNEKPKDLNTSKNLSSRANGKSYRNYIQIIATDKKRLFMLCGSCFWCASSYEYKDNLSREKCPVCQNERIELLSISNDDYDVRRGITSEFTSCQMDL